MEANGQTSEWSAIALQRKVFGFNGRCIKERLERGNTILKEKLFEVAIMVVADNEDEGAKS